MSGHGVYVIGIGSVHGDDRFGWEVVSRLQTACPPGVRTLATSDPLVLTELPHECELLMVVDACNGAGPVGSVHRFDWPDPQMLTLNALSSHGIGPGAALELAAALGKLPSRVIVFAAEIGSNEASGNLMPAVASVVPEVVARVLAEIATATGQVLG